MQRTNQQEERNKQWKEATANCRFHCKDGFFYDKINDVMKHCKCVIEAGLIENKRENQSKNLTLFDEKKENENWVILFYDKSKIFINESETKICFLADKGDIIFLPRLRQKIAINSISKILEIKDFYNQYPDQRPQPQKFFDFEEDNQNKESAYQKLYSSQTYCERAVADFTRIIEERKLKGLPYHNVEDLLAYAQNKLNKILCIKSMK